MAQNNNGSFKWILRKYGVKKKGVVNDKNPFVCFMS